MPWHGVSVQGDQLQQRMVEFRYREVWRVKPKDTMSPGAVQDDSMAVPPGMAAFDGNLQLHLPDNVPANNFAPDVLL